MSELSPYIAAYLMPQLSYSGYSPQLQFQICRPAYLRQLSSTALLLALHTCISPGASSVRRLLWFPVFFPRLPHFGISPYFHQFHVAFFIWSFAVRNFSTTSCHVVNVEASVFKWNPRTGLSGSSCTKVPSIKCSFHSASLDMTPHLLQAYLISDRSFCRTQHLTRPAVAVLRSTGTVRSILPGCCFHTPLLFWKPFDCRC